MKFPIFIDDKAPIHADNLSYTFMLETMDISKGRSASIVQPKDGGANQLDVLLNRIATFLGDSLTNERIRIIMEQCIAIGYTQCEIDNKLIDLPDDPKFVVPSR